MARPVEMPAAVPVKSPVADDPVLSLAEAAARVKVSTRSLSDMLDAGWMPYRGVGDARRVLQSDLDRWERESRVRGRRALEEMWKLGEELGV